MTDWPAVVTAVGTIIAAPLAILVTAWAGGKKLEQIHTLVNSNLTTAKEAEYATATALLASMKREQTRDVEADMPVDQSLADAMAVVSARVVALRAEIGDRLRATVVADSQAP